VLLGEPPPTQADLNFSLFGFTVRVHPFFWVMTLLLGAKRGDPASVLTWVVAVFLAILVHELGHALVIRAYGFHPWIVLHGMGGLTIHDPGVASRSRGSETLRQIAISAAGPAAGFLLAAILVLGLMLAGHGERIIFVGPWQLMPVVLLPNARLGDLCNDIFYISVFWGLVNLLPIYPLDGGQIAREILLKLSPRDGIRQSLWLSIIAAAAMAAFGLSRESILTAMFFGYLAYSSYTTLEAYRSRGPW
jgi:stage IV sporulation protein FB